MAVRCLFCGLDPTGKMGDILAVRNKRKGHRLCCLKPLQQVASLPNGKSVLWRLREDSDETELGDRASCQFWGSLCGQPPHPSGNALVEFVFKEAKRDQGIHIKQVFHGNSAKISRTCLLLKCGAPTPALRTGRPVIRSTRKVTLEKRVFRGVNTTRPACTFASSESPGWRPSRRRIAPASTIWPFVESFNSMVRKSYLRVRPTTSRFGGPGEVRTPDPMVANHVLSQLSYRPTLRIEL